MFKIYDRYLLRQLMVTTFVVAGGLSMIILLTQSLRLIELVLESNASSRSFFVLMALSAPRFFEAVMPASVLISTLFVFHRLSIDSEMVVLRSSGASPYRLAKPVISGCMMLAGFMLVLSLWISPLGISHMQQMRKEIKNQYAHLLFREGIFNTLGQNLTAYVRQRAADGRLVGLMVHDTRQLKEGGPAVTVVARSGNIVSEGENQKIIVYDGSRQEHDDKTDKFSRLDFKQYTLEIPSGDDSSIKRWQEPDERTLNELMVTEEPALTRQFRAEIHRRFSTPFLMMSFAMIGAVTLLLGPFSRGGHMPLVAFAALTALVLQGLYLAAFSMAKKSLMGILLMYGLGGVPLMLTLFCLTPAGERMMARLGRAARRIRHQGRA